LPPSWASAPQVIAAARTRVHPMRAFIPISLTTTV
jgi:hypothetical protein